MTRLFTEGFESGDMLRWTNYTGGWSSVASGRTGSGKYGHTGDTATAYFDCSLAEFYARVAFRFDQTTTNIFFQWYSDGNIIGAVSVSPAAGAAGVVSARVGGAAVESATVKCQVSEWHVFEIHVLIDAVGAIDVKFDGITIIAYAGDTRNGYATANRIYLKNSYGFNADFDDLAVNDVAGGVDDSWIGDGGVVAIVPDSAGTYSDLTASAGNAWDCVNEIPQNGDTDYIASSTIGHKSAFALGALPSLPAGATITRVWLELAAKETAASGGKIATFLRSGTTDAQGSDQNLTLAYARYLSAQYLVDPDDSAAWDSTKLNALEAGAVVR